MEAIVCQVVGATSNSLKVIPIAAIPLPSTSNYTSSSNLEGNTAPYTFNYTSAATKHLNDSWMNDTVGFGPYHSSWVKLSFHVQTVIQV